MAVAMVVERVLGMCRVGEDRRAVRMTIEQDGPAREPMVRVTLPDRAAAAGVADALGMVSDPMVLGMRWRGTVYGVDVWVVAR